MGMKVPSFSSKSSNASAAETVGRRSYDGVSRTHGSMDPGMASVLRVEGRSKLKTS